MSESESFIAQEEEAVPPSYQFRALVRKNAALQWKQWGANCFQIAVPIVLVCIAGGFQILFNVYLGGLFSPGEEVMTEADLITFNNGVNVPGGNTTSEYQNFNLWHSEPTWTPIIGNLTETGGKQGMLGQIYQVVNETDPITTYSPWYEFIPDEQDMLDDILNDKEYWTQFLLANQEFPMCYTCPKGANIFNEVSFGATAQDASKIDYEILIDTQMGQDEFGITPFISESIMMNMMDTAFVNQATGEHWTIMAWAQELPYVTLAPSFDIGSFLGLLLYPFAVSFVMAIYVTALVREKQERLREMMRMMGLKMSWYWFVNYIWDIFLYAIIISVMIGTSLAFRLVMFTETSIVLWIVILVGWGNALIALSFLLSTFFNRALTSTIVTYTLVIAGVVISYVLNATIFKNNADNPVVYTILFLYPPFACYRAIYLIGAGCTILQCPQLNEIQIGGELFYIMIFLYIDTVLYFVAAFYLDAVLPRQFGVPKHPLFPIRALMKWIKKKRAGSVTNEEMGNLMLPHEGISDELLHDEELEEDDDVKREADLIRSSKIPISSPIIINNLRKIYKAKAGTPQKIAVKNLNLHVEKGECFGLLGPNGAGKTTTISILTGLYPPTSGTACISGFSIKEDMDKIHRVMSVCPQFDTVWMTLTCRETLLFYARLKGISSKEEKHHVEEILEKVGLSQYAKRKAKDLSGGMRRRLSIGIALVGNPRVVFLDEPTTGLDPETRRHLWDVLLEVKQGRCIILTTHSMEEADILCNRIAIMSKGRFMCLGDQMHLKKKFGEGYTLHVNFSAENEQGVLKFIGDMLPTATLMENFAGNCVYQIKTGDLVVSDLFEQMETNKQAVGIQDWGITQTTMEDVFIRIARNDEHEDETKP